MFRPCGDTSHTDASRTINQALERHGGGVLQLSGGKDSLACLYLARPFWERLTVMWCNTGAAFPETHAQMGRIRKMVPHFIEVNGDVPGSIKRDGPAADLLPVWNSAFGRLLQAERTTPIQTPLSCCAENIWRPMAQGVKDLNATLVIRGQRTTERRKSPIRSGHIEDGVEYVLPIESWSSDDVRGYLKSAGVSLGEHYEYIDTSLDCWSCVGYLDENQRKYEYMKFRHPELHTRVRDLLKLIHAEASREMACLERAIGKGD